MKSIEGGFTCSSYVLHLSMLFQYHIYVQTHIEGGPDE